MQTVTPYLLYEDVGTAIDWLGRAFGFAERLRFADASGTVTHAELALGDGEVFLGHPGPDYASPKSLGAFTDLVHVYVDDVDAHSPGPSRQGRRSTPGSRTRRTATGATTPRIPRGIAGRSPSTAHGAEPRSGGRRSRPRLEDRGQLEPAIERAQLRLRCVASLWRARL